MSRNYEANVTFEVWSQGGDPDLIDRDRVWESEAVGDYAEECASREVRAQGRHSYENEDW